MVFSPGIGSLTQAPQPVYACYTVRIQVPDQNMPERAFAGAVHTVSDCKHTGNFFVLHFLHTQTFTSQQAGELGWEQQDVTMQGCGLSTGIFEQIKMQCNAMQ